MKSSGVVGYAPSYFDHRAYTSMVSIGLSEAWRSKFPTSGRMLLRRGGGRVLCDVVSIYTASKQPRPSFSTSRSSYADCRMGTSSITMRSPILRALDITLTTERASSEDDSRLVRFFHSTINRCAGAYVAQERCQIVLSEVFEADVNRTLKHEKLG